MKRMREIREQWAPMKPKDVRDSREDLDLTQQQLGELLGVHRGTVSRWETHGPVPPIAALAIAGIVLVEVGAADV